jgi:hypothetical protein
MASSRLQFVEEKEPTTKSPKIIVVVAYKFFGSFSLGDHWYSIIELHFAFF